MTAVEIARLGFADKCQVNVDPTLLLTPDEWRKHSPKQPLNEGKYIFLYNPYFLPQVYEQAKELSKLTGLKVVVSNINIKSLAFLGGFKKKLDVGPWEFLNLVDNATYVVGRSFHLLVFSILFKKQFIAVEGLGDSRLSNLLNVTALQQCATNNGNVSEILQNIQNLNFDHAFQAIEKERQRSFDYFKQIIL